MQVDVLVYTCMSCWMQVMCVGVALFAQYAGEHSVRAFLHGVCMQRYVVAIPPPLISGYHKPRGFVDLFKIF